MTPIKKIFLSLLMLMFNWEFSAHAIHSWDKVTTTTIDGYRVTAGTACATFCAHFGEKEILPATYTNWSGNFHSCLCMTTSEVNTCNACNTTACGGGLAGYRRCYVDINSVASMWCTATSSNRDNVLTGCYCSLAGYYKYANGSASYDCAKCPESPPATSAARSSGIQSCYMPSGTTLTNARGRYSFTSNCYYS